MATLDYQTSKRRCRLRGRTVLLFLAITTVLAVALCFKDRARSQLYYLQVQRECVESMRGSAITATASSIEELSNHDPRYISHNYGLFRWHPPTIIPYIRTIVGYPIARIASGMEEQFTIAVAKRMSGTGKERVVIIRCCSFGSIDWRVIEPAGWTSPARAVATGSVQVPQIAAARKITTLLDDDDQRRFKIDYLVDGDHRLLLAQLQEDDKIRLTDSHGVVLRDMEATRER